MLERVRNLIKNDKRKSPASSDMVVSAPKRNKATDNSLIRRYPVRMPPHEEDAETIQQHVKAIQEEMTKTKPREHVLMPLIKNTSTERWLFIKENTPNVGVVIEKYPFLKLPAIVSNVCVCVCVCVCVKYVIIVSVVGTGNGVNYGSTQHQISIHPGMG